MKRCRECNYMIIHPNKALGCLYFAQFGPTSELEAMREGACGDCDEFRAIPEIKPM